MISFKEFNQLEKHCLTEGLLLEGKYLNLVKHFVVKLYQIRKIAKYAEAVNRGWVKDPNINDEHEIEQHLPNNEVVKKKVKKALLAMGNDTNFLASESRGLISMLPDYYQPMLKQMVEKISGEPIGQFDPEVVERMFGWNCYKKYFKLYVLNFVMEVLLLVSVENEPVFDAVMKDLNTIYLKIDSFGKSGDIKQSVKELMDLVPKVISMVGRITKLSAKGFE